MTTQTEAAGKRERRAQSSADHMEAGWRQADDRLQVTPPLLLRADEGLVLALI